MRIAVARPAQSGSKSIARTVVIVFAAIGFAISVADVGFSAPLKSVPLRLEVTLQKPTTKGEIGLQLKLTNVSEVRVTVDELDLPWVAPNELEFLERAYRSDTVQGALQMKGPMVDYFGRAMDIQPGHSLEGILNLQAYISGLERALRQSDVTVEWNCRSGTLAFICHEGERGSIIIHKKQSAQKESMPTTP